MVAPPGIWHSAAVYYGWALVVWPLLEMAPSDDPDLWSFGAAVAGNSVLVVNLKLLVESRHWNWYSTNCQLQ